MTLIPEKSISLGQYVVSPSTRLTKAGHYSASVAVSSGHGIHQKLHHMCSDARFASREGARIFALTQGWLHTFGPQSA